jgi:hypothetical protein
MISLYIQDNECKTQVKYIDIVTDLLKALSYEVRKPPLLGKHIFNAGDNRRIAVSITVEENDH